MAHPSLGSPESTMKNQTQSSYHGALGSSLGNLLKNQFDFLGEDEDEEPTSVLDLTPCISPPLQADVWAQRQAVMEYEREQQQQIFMWQQHNQNQQLWEQQQLLQAELRYLLNADLDKDQIWDPYRHSLNIHENDNCDTWVNSATDVQQVHVSETPLQGLPQLDDAFLLENWISCSSDSSLTSVTDESSSPSLVLDDLESVVCTEQQQQVVSSTTAHNAFGQARSTTTQQYLEIDDITVDDHELQLAMKNFTASTCLDIAQSSIEEMTNPSDWFFPAHQESVYVGQTTATGSPRVTPSTQQVQKATLPQYPIPLSVPFSNGEESTNHLRKLPEFTQDLQLSPVASEIKPSVESPATSPEFPKANGSPSVSSAGTATKSDKLWGPPRPSSHFLGNNSRQPAGKPVSADTTPAPLSRKRSFPDFTVDQNSGHDLVRGKSYPSTPQKAGQHNISSNNSSSTTRGHGPSQSTGSGRVVTLAELASGGVKMGGVQLPTVGTQIPSVVRLAMETQASGLGGVRMVQILLACAEAVACRDSRQANILLQQLQHMASPYGDAMQRITACFMEGLTARLAITGSQPFKFSNPPRKPPTESEKLEGFNLVYQSSPYLAFGHFAANSAILEAFEGEQRLHVIDLGMTHALQWPYLIHGLAKRPGGPPRLLRITGFGLSTTPMQEAGKELARIANDFNIPFEFRAVTESLEGLGRSMLQLREGEAVAVNSVLQLHCVVKESRGSLNAVLQSIHDLSPKILTLVEQDASHNGPFFLGRFMESLHYYSAIFDSLDAILPRNSKQRVTMEQFHFAEEIKNIVSCEGPARVERHERVDQWRRRMSRAGFQPLPLKFLSQARMWLGLYSCGGYTLSEEKGCLVLGWKGKPIIAASSWKR